MKTIRESNAYFFLLSALLLASGLFTSYQANAEVVIVVNESISDSSIAADDVGNVFLGKKRSLESGNKIKPVTLKSGASHDEFLSNFVKKSSSQFSAFWKKKIVDGTGIPPKSFSSEQELINYVKSHSDAMGYVSSSADTTGLKILSVN